MTGEVQTAGTKRTDGMKRARSLVAKPLGDSPAQLEQRSLEAGQEYFGPGAQLELEEDYTTFDRWDCVLTGHAPEPRYRGNIKVYELVPDPDTGEETPAPRRTRPERNMPGLADIMSQALNDAGRAAAERARHLVAARGDLCEARIEAVIAERLVQVAADIQSAVHR